VKKKMCLEQVWTSDLRLLISRQKQSDRISWPKREEVTGVWQKLHNDELHNLYSTDINRVIKSMFMRLAG
jgi:hypothetical protein